MAVNLNNIPYFNAISDSFHTAPRKNIAIISIGIGILAYPLIKKVISVAYDIFNRYLEITMLYIKQSSLYVRMHSLTCEECAQKHRYHMSNPILNIVIPILQDSED